MKLDIVKNKLKDAILLADRMSGKNLSLPVLRHVLMLASERMLILRATNLDIGIEIMLPAKIEKEGVLAVPGDILGNYLSYLSDEKNVVLEQVNQNLMISSERHSTLVKCHGYEDFPTIPFPTKGTTFSIDAKHLFAGFRSVHFSVATSDMKPEFASIYCYSEGGHLFFVGTDTSRLAEKKMAVKGIPDGLSFLLPGKNAAEIIRCMEGSEGVVEVVLTKNQIGISSESIRITSRLIDGTFPDYRQIIPKQQLSEVVVLREEFASALKMTTVFSGKLQQVRMKIVPSEKLFEIEAKEDSLGESTNRVDATMKGEDVELLFNQRLLADVMSHCSTDSIALIAAGPGKPLMIHGIGDQSFRYLVMPMRNM